MFPLLKYFSFASAIAITIAGIILATFFWFDQKNKEINRVETQNIRLAQTMSNVVWPRYNIYVNSVAELSGDELLDRPETDEIHKTISELVKNLPVLKVKLYALNGKTVYSSQFSQIGASKAENQGFLATSLTGVTKGKMSFRPKFHAFSGEKLERYVVETYVPIYLKNEKIDGVFEIYTDVTGNIKEIHWALSQFLVLGLVVFTTLWAALLMIIRKAEKIIKTQNEELEKTKNKAEENNRAKSVFLSNMSHELRTPLNGILGFAQMLDMNRQENLSEKQKGWVAQILVSGGLLLALINDVLELARIESGHVNYVPQEFQPSEVFKECCGVIKPLAKEREITLQGMPETERLINVDKDKFKQVILNLLGNAVKYGNDKGHIRFGCRDLGQDQIEIYVADDGIGIPENEINEIFKIFYRVPGASSTIEGTGVGLSIVKRNLELMNGKITVTSSLGEGSCFTIILPATNKDDIKEVMDYQI